MWGFSPRPRPPSSPCSLRPAAMDRCCRPANNSSVGRKLSPTNPFPVANRVDEMTKTRHLAAVQKVGPGPDHMPIGEFGGGAALPGSASPFFAAPMSWFYEMGQAALTPSRAFADAGRMFFKNPANPFAHTSAGKAAAAAFELFERTTRRYSQPDWMIDSTMVGGERVPVHVTRMWERPFCRLLH